MSGVLALSGGVGGAKLARGLARILPSGALTVVCNTGDDFDHLGLRICPDLDSVMYAIAGSADAARGWGRRDESFQMMSALRELGGPDWFRLGDRDVATHLLRTELLRTGLPLSAVTAKLCTALGITQRILPMTDDDLRTELETDAGVLAFQDYFVRRCAEPRVKAIRYRGAEQARAPATMQPAAVADCGTIVICPSNPYLSIDPVLAIADWRAWLLATQAPVIAVSPIIAGQALKGPAGKIMAELGEPISALTVARHYRGIIDALVIDQQDLALKNPIEALGMRCEVTATIMTEDRERDALASFVLAAAERLRCGP